MKSIFFILLLSLSVSVHSQELDNRFHQEENVESSEEVYSEEQNRGPGNPGEGIVPIDDHLPYLLVTALGIMAYATHKRKNILNQNKTHGLK